MIRGQQPIIQVHLKESQDYKKGLVAAILQIIIKVTKARENSESVVEIGSFVGQDTLGYSIDLFRILGSLLTPEQLSWPTTMGLAAFVKKAQSFLAKDSDTDPMFISTVSMLNAQNALEQVLPVIGKLDPVQLYELVIGSTNTILLDVRIPFKSLPDKDLETVLNEIQHFENGIFDDEILSRQNLSLEARIASGKLTPAVEGDPMLLFEARENIKAATGEREGSIVDPVFKIVTDVGRLAIAETWNVSLEESGARLGKFTANMLLMNLEELQSQEVALQRATEMTTIKLVRATQNKELKEQTRKILNYIDQQVEEEEEDGGSLSSLETTITTDPEAMKKSSLLIKALFIIRNRRNLLTTAPNPPIVESISFKVASDADERGVSVNPNVVSLGVKSSLEDLESLIPQGDSLITTSKGQAELLSRVVEELEFTNDENLRPNQAPTPEQLTIVDRLVKVSENITENIQEDLETLLVINPITADSLESVLSTALSNQDSSPKAPPSFPVKDVKSCTSIILKEPNNFKVINRKDGPSLLMEQTKFNELLQSISSKIGRNSPSIASPSLDGHLASAAA